MGDWPSDKSSVDQEGPSNIERHSCWQIITFTSCHHTRLLGWHHDYHLGCHHDRHDCHPQTIKASYLEAVWQAVLCKTQHTRWCHWWCSSSAMGAVLEKKKINMLHSKQGCLGARVGTPWQDKNLVTRCINLAEMHELHWASFSCMSCTELRKLGWVVWADFNCIDTVVVVQGLFWHRGVRLSEKAKKWWVGGCCRPEVVHVNVKSSCWTRLKMIHFFTRSLGAPGPWLLVYRMKKSRFFLKIWRRNKPKNQVVFCDNERRGRTERRNCLL